nr:MAG TPA: hypothetical protein [Bacteriophage sp.]
MLSGHTAFGSLVLACNLHPHPHLYPGFWTLLTSPVLTFNHNLLLHIPPNLLEYRGQL